MKLIKKSLVAVLAIAMAMFFAFSALAEETGYSLTISGTKAGHALTIYQVMEAESITGTQGTNAESNGYILGNAKWASGVTAFKAGNTTSTVTSGDVVTEEEKEALNTLTGEAIADAFTLGTAYKTVTTADNSTVISGLPYGYYIVVDTTSKSMSDGDTIARTAVQVVGNTTIKAKTGTVSSEKKVGDVNDTTGEVTNVAATTNKLGDVTLADSADHEIGDVIEYTIIAQLPENYADYDTYYLKFVDDMSKGLTYVANSAEIHYGKDAAGVALEPTKQTTGSGYENGSLYTWEVSDLKSVSAASSLQAGSLVYITYKAQLNMSAEVGNPGNPNKMHIEYSSNPNTDKGGEHGTTPDDVNIVFTYKTVFNKVDESEKPLTGADFKLEKLVASDEGEEVTINNKTYKGVWTDVTSLGDTTNHPSKTGDSNGTEFAFTGLDDGFYRLTETTTPAGYNTIDPQLFEITAAHELIADTPALTELTGTNGTEFTMTKNLSDGSLTTNIKNNKGSILPSTGGIGTTIFYVVGAVLVVLAGALLVTRRRMAE